MFDSSLRHHVRSRKPAIVSIAGFLAFCITEVIRHPVLFLQPVASRGLAPAFHSGKCLNAVDSVPSVPAGSHAGDLCAPLTGGA